MRKGASEIRRSLGWGVLAGAALSLGFASAALARVNSITITTPTHARFRHEYRVTFKGYAEHKAQFVYIWVGDSAKACAPTPIGEIVATDGTPSAATVHRTFRVHGSFTDDVFGHPKGWTDTFCAYLVDIRTDAVLAHAGAHVRIN